ncbi:MAG TPA: hypothetical protein VG845_11080 [Dehalococcoidia bacterium]|nr:hypothetical protein [Dehalococcoidia bacterium]
MFLTLVLAWQWAAGQSINLFIAALALGSLLDFIGRVGGASFSVRSRVFALPPLVLLVAGIPFEDRLWLIPFWLVLIAFFAVMCFAQTSRVDLTHAEVRLRSLGRVWSVPYADIVRRRPTKPGHPVRLALSNPVRGRMRILGSTQEISFSLAEGDVPEFLSELRSRTGNSEI